MKYEGGNIEMDYNCERKCDAAAPKQLGTLRSLTSVYLTCGEQILLLYRQGSRVVNNKWISSAGGHFEDGEFRDARLCTLREVKEELGLDGDALQNLSLRYVSLRRTPEEIRQNYYFFAELPDGPSMELTSNEGVLQWFHLDEIESLDMPFTSKYVTSHWLHTGQFTDALYGGVATGEDMVFTELTEF